MANRGKVESYRRIKGVNGRLVLGEEELRRIWKDYFDDLYNTNIEEKVTVHKCDFDGIQT